MQKVVEAALQWLPLTQTAEIAVAVKGGIATLTVTVDACPKKTAVEDAVKNVAGVKGVVVKMNVREAAAPPQSHRKLIKEVRRVLNNNWPIPKDSVEAMEENGRVTLTGVVPWLYQKFAAQAYIGYVPGVKSVTNDIIVQSELHNAIEQRNVERALARNWALKVRDITVKADAETLRLSGIVSSLYQKEAAGYIAANVGGIAVVDNRLIVEPHHARRNRPQPKSLEVERQLF